MFASAALARDPGSVADILEQAVEEGGRHAAAAYASVFALAFDALPAIELPPGAETRVDRAQMRALSALYLAADLEPAGVVASAEDLAALAATGALRVDLGSAAPALHRFWRDRNHRSSASERLAFFGRLFGASYGAPAPDGGANQAFEPLMLELCEALYRIGDAVQTSRHGAISQQTRIRAAARNLLANLVDGGGGATPFMAREIMDGLRAALDILQDEHLRGIFGARDIWDVISGIGRLSRRPPVGDPRLFVRRGKAGMTVISWLADASEALRQYGAPVATIDSQAIPAAIEWLQASLTISETQIQQGAAPPSGPATGGVSGWAELGI